MIRVAGAVVAGFALSGCAASTGVLPAGPGTYAVTAKFAPIRGGSVTAQGEASAEAQAFCQRQGQVYAPLQMNETAPRLYWGSTGYQIVFRCVASTPAE